MGPTRTEDQERMVKQSIPLTRMSTSNWGATFSKARQVHSAIIHPAITYSSAVRYMPRDVKKSKNPAAYPDEARVANAHEKSSFNQWKNNTWISVYVHGRRTRRAASNPQWLKWPLSKKRQKAHLLLKKAESALIRKIRTEIIGQSSRLPS